MKKNRGNKSNVKKAKEQKKAPSFRYGGTRNHKFLCLYCLKSTKAQSKCCGFKTYPLGSIPRAPKVNAPKQEWKKFFDMFVSGSRVENKGQLKRIITLRKQYGLSTTLAETKLKELSNKIENDIIGVFDIQRHETVEIYIGSKSPYRQIMNGINELAKRFGYIPHDKLEYDTEYYVVPLFAAHYNTYYIPTNINKFNIQKCRTKKIPKRYSTEHTLGLNVLTNNKKETVDISYSPDSQYGYRQSFYVFSDRVKAMAFRQELLSTIFPLLKEKELPYVNEILNIVNLDFERVIKKSPEILV